MTESYDGSDDEELETTQVDQMFELKFNDKVIHSNTHMKDR